VASPDKKAFLLRLPPDVWSQIERLAATELRSVNGQIEYMLRDALARRLGGEAGRAAPSTAEPEADPKAPRARESRKR
jgi:hypothetical protein